MALNRRPLVGLAVLVVGGAFLAAVGLLGPLGSSAQATVVRPTPPAQQISCPGGLLQVGASGSASSLSSAAAAKLTKGTLGSGTKTTTKRLARGGVSEGAKAGSLTLNAPAASGASGLLAAAQSQTASGSAVAGFAAAACTTPGTVSWLVGGSTTTGRTSVLLLSNRSSVAATVDLAIWTDKGRATGTGLTDITVAANAQRAIPLASLVPDAAATAIRVTSRGGQPAATLESSVVRGLETGGIDTVGATAAPATTVVIPGVRVRNGAAVAAAAQTTGYADLATVVRLLAPTRAAAVSVTAIGASGSGSTVRQAKRLTAGDVAEIPLTGLADGTYTVTVISDAPIVAAARTSTIASGEATSSTGVTAGSTTDGTDGTDGTSTGTDGGSDAGVASGATLDTGTRLLDFAWFPSAATLGTDATTAVAAGPAPQLTLANPTKHAVAVRLSGAVSTGVSVPAGQSMTVAASTGIVGLTGASGLVAAVSYAGSGAVAGYPVAPSTLQSVSVTVTH
jgi:Family of unknown function (DUF5719)